MFWPLLGNTEYQNYLRRINETLSVWNQSEISLYNEGMILSKLHSDAVLKLLSV
jgi:hypothetical protein